MLTQRTPLQEWATSHEPSDKLIYNGGYWDQINFVRDYITHILARSPEDYDQIMKDLVVISEHTSKSVRLPVFQMKISDGTIFTMRCNFYDWKISVASFQEVNADFMGLFDPEMKIPDCYCEGFTERLVYGSYSTNKRQFTIELPSDNYCVFTFFWIFAYNVFGVKKKQH